MEQERKEQQSSTLPDNQRTMPARAREEERRQKLTNITQKSINEATVPLLPVELEPYVKVIRPARPSLTYERAE